MMKIFTPLLIAILCPFFALSQNLVSINPASANAGQTLNVTITGASTNFTQGSGSTIDFYFNQGSTTVVNSYTVLSNTSISANITVPSNMYTGDYTVAVYNSVDGYLNLYNGFHVNGITPPSLVSINPASANAGQTLNVTITGASTNFTQGSGSTIDFYFNQGSTTVVNSYTVLSNTSISANITVPSNTYTGNYTVAVYNPIDGYLNLNNGFYVNGISPPSLVSVNPASANAGQTLNVTITGGSTNFTQGSGSTVDFYFNQGSTTVVNSYTVLSNTSISANITVPSNTYTGNYTVSVYNPIDGYLNLYNGFYVNGISPPSLVSIDPASANAGQTLNVTITGGSTSFTQGSGSIIDFNFGQGSGTTVVNSYTVLSNTSISANITVPSNINAGDYTVTVYNPTDGYLSLYNGFHINGSAPCNVAAGFIYVDNGNGNYSFTNVSMGNVSLQNWNFGDGNTSALTNPTHTFVANGTYVIVLTVTDATTPGGSCYDYMTATINVTGVTNPVACNAAFAMFADSVTNTVTVINSSTGNNLSYYWDFGDSNSSSLAHPNYTYSTGGPFLLCLSISDSLGCTSSYCDSIGPNGVVFKAGGFTLNVVDPTAVEVNEISNVFSEVNIYPNPTTGNITIDLGEMKTDLTTTLSNCLGQVISTQQFISANVINMSIDAPLGIYFLKVETADGETKTIKVLKK